MKRAFVIVCDSLGVGELPDASDFGDEGSNTLGHVLELEKPSLPTLSSLGLLHTLPNAPDFHPSEGAVWGRMAEVSAGKDTITGHWEMMGLIVEVPFRTYPEGFPLEVIDSFESRIRRTTLGNKAASGTEIIEELGVSHMESGKPIVYTSGDSVFQVAAHEDIIPPRELWDICEVAREIMRGEHNVGRIIARPFIGTGPGQFTRTANRRDFSVRPTGETVIERLSRNGKKVIGLGKIADIFDRVGIDQEIRTQSNSDGMKQTIDLARNSEASLVFTNLVDFDSKYGHRNDSPGYARALELFDAELADLVGVLQPEDLLLITADHGCDPTDVSTDHTREYVPLIIAGPALRGRTDLGTRATFADLGCTVAEYLGEKSDGFRGTSAVADAGLTVS